MLFGLLAFSAALPVKSSMSDEAVTADFGVLCSCFLRAPLSIVWVGLIWFGEGLRFGLGFTASTRFLCVFCAPCRCSTMPDWRIILVQEFLFSPSSSFVFSALFSALLSPHPPLIFAYMLRRPLALIAYREPAGPKHVIVLIEQHGAKFWVLAEAC